MTSLYSDPNRTKGSQSEEPAHWYEGKFICFDGYQRFHLASDSIRLGKLDHRKKYSIVRPYLLGKGNEGASIIDLGCSAGVMGFQAFLDGFENITFIDHDAEYLNLVRAGLRHVDAKEAKVEESKVHEVTSTADILFAFAIIHWLYSCTESFGSLDRVVREISLHCRETMFIEWIDPECPDIQSFGHLTWNPEIQTDGYSRDRFIDALKSRFPFVKRIGRVRQGREIWIASRHRCRPRLSIWARERIAFHVWALVKRIRNRL